MKVRPSNRSIAFPPMVRPSLLFALLASTVAVSGSSLGSTATSAAVGTARVMPAHSLAATPPAGAGLPPEGAGSASPATVPAIPGSAGSDGLVTIESDIQQADNRTGVVTATGNVRITYPDRRLVATSRQAQYYSREGRLILSGDVEVIDADGQRIRAERLVYRLDSERFEAIPATGRQVLSRLRLQPQAGGVAPSLLP